MKRKILQLVGSFHQGGSEQQAIQLIKTLREKGIAEIFVATLDKNGPLLGQFSDIEQADIQEFSLRSFYDINFLRQIKECSKLIRRHNIDIVQTHDFYTNVFGILSAKTARRVRVIAAKRETGGMRSSAQQKIESMLLKRADRIVANSDAVRDLLISYKIDGTKINTIYNGVDLQRFSRPFDRREICEMFGLSYSDKFITMVGNLRHAVKNYPMFLRAADLITKKFNDIHFIVAGEGDLQPELENMAIDLGIKDNVHFLGRCSAVPELLSISHVGVLTSDAEGFSNSILEYMAAGLPVVATNVGGAAEAIAENISGFLIEPNDHRSLAERLCYLIQNENIATEFGREGRKSVSTNFDRETQLLKMLRLYDEISPGIE